MKKKKKKKKEPCLCFLLHFLVAFCSVMIHIYLRNKNTLLLGSSIKILFFML